MRCQSKLFIDEKTFLGKCVYILIYTVANISWNISLQMMHFDARCDKYIFVLLTHTHSVRCLKCGGIYHLCFEWYFCYQKEIISCKVQNLKLKKCVKRISKYWEFLEHHIHSTQYRHTKISLASSKSGKDNMHPIGLIIQRFVRVYQRPLFDDIIYCKEG